MAVALEMTANTANSITLRITGLTGTSYKTLSINLAGVVKNVTLSSGGNTTTAQFTNLSGNGSYYTTATVVSSGGSTASPWGTFYTLTNSPTGLNITNRGANGFTVNWTAPSGGNSGYRLAVRQGTTYTGTLVREYTPSSSSTSQSVTGLSANTSYFVGLVAKNSQGQESLSATTTTSTTVAKPSTPTNVMANSSITSNSVYVSWSSASGATGYRVETYIGSSFQKSNTTTSTGLTITGLSPSTSYTFRVYAYNSGGDSPSYDYNYATTNPTSATVYLNSITDSSVYAYWAKGSDVTSFDYEIRKGAILGTLVESGSTTLNYKTFTGLTDGTLYYVKVSANNSSTGKSSGWSFETFTTLVKPKAPSAPSTATATVVSSTSAKISWSSSTGATSYRVQMIYADLSGSAFDQNVGNVTSYTVTGLKAGRGYFVSVYAVNDVGSNSKGTEVTLPPTEMSGLTSSVSNNSLTVRWTANTGVDAMEYELRKSSVSGTLVSSGSITGSSKTFSSLDYNTLYYFRIRGKSTSTNVYTSWVAVTDTTTPQAPSFSLTSNSTTAGVVYVYFNTVSGATSYSANIYDGKTNAYVNTVTGTTSPLTFTGLKEYYPYGVYLKAINSTHGNSAESSSSITTNDVTPPVLNITSAISEGVMQLVWSASDAHSGLRSASRYAVSITANGGTSYVHKAYTNNLYYSFTSDANGNEFVDGGKYYMRVIAYDEQNNTTTKTSGQVTYKRARPLDWNWQNSKVKGQPWNMTAMEWNSLATRVNQFRQYKKLDNYAFTTVKVGDKMTATIYNQMRTAINAMSPPTALPSAVSKDTTILASHFTGLTASLNSIK